MLNDAKVGRIGRNYLVPYFQQGEYGRGILEASFAVKSILLNETDSDHYVDDSSDEYPPDSNGIQITGSPVLGVIITLLFFGFAIFMIFYSRRKGGFMFGGFGGGRLGGGGFGGGSGGGFGGGSFGGGGSSGKW